MRPVRTPACVGDSFDDEGDNDNAMDRDETPEAAAPVAETAAAKVIAAAAAMHDAGDRAGYVPLGGVGPGWPQKFRCQELVGALAWEAAGTGSGPEAPVLQWFLGAVDTVE